MRAPLSITGTMDVRAGGTLRVTDDASGEERTATGLWHIKVNRQNHAIDVVLTLPSERYVAAVLNAEAAVGEPAESLRALAIVARTYALTGTHYRAQSGHLPAELCDSTECQALRLGKVSSAVDDAVRATTGETLWFGNLRAKVFFSQSCGGVTEDVGAVWPSLHGVSYLRSHADPFCLRRDFAAWHAEVPWNEFVTIAHAEGWHVPESINRVSVVERSASHRAVRIAFSGADRTATFVSASALRFGIGRALGWNRVRSDAYILSLHNRVLVFDGHGHGHGVGLCQLGASEMADEGRLAREILEFYFPATRVRILPNGEGWRREQVGALHVVSVDVFTKEQQDDLLATWKDAQRRFPPRRPADAEIIFAPSTELFRQLTTEPGWALASTRGNTIVLQPKAVLQAHETDVGATLLHEMLHVLVEAEAGELAPLWLREGLVEILAGEPTAAPRGKQMDVGAIDRALLHPRSFAESELSHQAAAARVHALAVRYGLLALRGWLSTGIPAGAT